jgi:hypothetical protein
VYTGELEKDLAKDVLDKTEKLVWDNNTQNFISVNKSLHEHADYKEVTDFLSRELEKIRVDMNLNCEKLSIVLMWGNKALQGQWHHVHNHKRSWGSGILYLSDSGSQTWFSYSDFWDKSELLAIHSDTPENQLYYKNPVVPGQYIFFPSHLLHSVNEHDLVYPRYSLAFNVFPSGTMGSLYSASHLNLKP